MNRQVVGAFAAAAAAPYLLISIVMSILLSSSSPGELATWEAVGYVVANVAVYGSIGVVICGFPLIAVSYMTANLLDRLGQEKVGAAILTGAMVGLCIGLLLLVEVIRFVLTAPDILSFLLPFLLTGALCGWIYWRIAIRGASVPEKGA